MFILFYVGNLFLEITYSRENDLPGFKSVQSRIQVESEILDFLLSPHYNNNNIGIVTGEVGVGKSQFISQSIGTATKQYKLNLDRQRVTNLPQAHQEGVSYETSKKSGIFYYSEKPINPFVMDAIRIPCLGLEQPSDVVQYLNRIFSQVDNDDSDCTQIIHVDCTSSHQIIEIIPWLEKAVVKKSPKVKVILESVELSHIDPHFIYKIPVFHIKESIFTIDQIYTGHVTKLINRYCVII